MKQFKEKLRRRIHDTAFYTPKHINVVLASRHKMLQPAEQQRHEIEALREHSPAIVKNHDGMVDLVKTLGCQFQVEQLKDKLAEVEA